MTDLDRSEFEERLWKAIEHEKTGMLGVLGGPEQHLQPMTGYPERETGAVWFFVRRDNDLIRQLDQGGGKAMFCLNDGKAVWACMSGDLIERRDQDRIDRFWNPVAGAWFPEGKDDPELTLLRFDLIDAQVWVSQKGPLRFAYEIARANATHDEPDVGDQAHLRFH